MSKHYKSRKRAKRPLDLVGLKEGRYATIADMSIPASGHPVSPEVLYAKFLQAAKDLRNACPSRAPVRRFQSRTNMRYSCEDVNGLSS